MLQGSEFQSPGATDEKALLPLCFSFVTWHKQQALIT